MGSFPKKIAVIAIALLSVLFIGSTVMANSIDVSSIEDGEHIVDIDVLQSDKDEPSTAAQYINDEATLIIDGDDAKLRITIPTIEGFTFSAFSIQGNDAVVDGEQMTFTLNELQSTVDALVSYKVDMAGLQFEHDDVGLRFVINGLNDLPEMEEPEEEPEEPEEEPNEPEEEPEAPEEDEEDNRVPGDLITDADETEEVTYVTDTSMIERYFDNPATLVHKDGKKYIQINGNSAQYITSLTINGEEVTWSEIAEDGTYTFQFEHVWALEEELVFGMTIDTNNPNFGAMEHEVSLSFVKENNDDEGEEGTDEEDDGNEGEEGTDDEDEVDEEENNGDTGKDETPSKDEEEEDTNKETLVPDKAYEIDFIIKHKDGNKESVANEFFLKPALLLEKDGNKYVQLTISNGEMVKELKNQYGKALVVKTNKDGSIVVQLRVDNDLSDQLLSMFISVPSGAIPGFPGYNESHEAILSFVKGSQEEIEVKDEMLVGTNNKDNGNGPFSVASAGDEMGESSSGSGDKGSENTPSSNQGPDKPTFGDKQDNKGSSTGQPLNPKTGDTSNILLYALLLIGSLTPLALQLRRRFN